MTKLQVEKIHDMLNVLIQREINGHSYVNMVEVSIDHCGGWKLEISDVPLFHDTDILAIIGICGVYCISFQLYLNEKRIVLI